MENIPSTHQKFESITSMFPQDAQKARPARPHPMEAPEA